LIQFPVQRYSINFMFIYNVHTEREFRRAETAHRWRDCTYLCTSRVQARESTIGVHADSAGFSAQACRCIARCGHSELAVSTCGVRTRRGSMRAHQESRGVMPRDGYRRHTRTLRVGCIAARAGCPPRVHNVEDGTQSRDGMGCSARAGIPRSQSGIPHIEDSAHGENARREGEGEEMQ
jgi:hypothetical protein